MTTSVGERPSSRHERAYRWSRRFRRGELGGNPWHASTAGWRVFRQLAGSDERLRLGEQLAVRTIDDGSHLLLYAVDDRGWKPREDVPACGVVVARDFERRNRSRSWRSCGGQHDQR